MLNLATIHEAIAERVPERACLICRARRYSWRDVTDRTRRLAGLLGRHGLGCHTKREALEGWESGQDHVALYLYNGNEYLEGMLGAFQARAVPVNVNYRYVDEELVYLLNDARAKAVVFHASFAPTLARVSIGKSCCSVCSASRRPTAASAQRRRQRCGSSRRFRGCVRWISSTEPPRRDSRGSRC